MSQLDDLLGIAVLATLGWTAALVAQPELPAEIAASVARAVPALPVGAVRIEGAHATQASRVCAPPRG